MTKCIVAVGIFVGGLFLGVMLGTYVTLYVLNKEIPQAGELIDEWLSKQER